MTERKKTLDEFERAKADLRQAIKDSWLGRAWLWTLYWLNEFAGAIGF